MASYVKRVVNRDPDEQIVYRAFISIWSLLPNFLLGIVFLAGSVLALMKLEEYGAGQFAIPVTAGLGAIGLIILAHAVAVFYTTEIAITNKQLITKPGIIARDGTTLLLSKCESCNLKQSVIGRVLDYGSIIVSGAGDTNAVMPGISDPMGFQDTYAQCYKAAKES